MFRTLECSPLPEPFQGLAFVTVKSRALRGRADITLFVPPQARSLTDVPLVVLLHGIYGSHWVWAVKGGAHRIVQKLIDSGAVPPMVLAMPSDGLWGDGSGYVPHPAQDFEKWIVEDVPAAVFLAARCVSAKSPVFLAGLSMGGFGALRIGCKYPARYNGISAHSAITRLDQMQTYAEEDLSQIGADPGNVDVWETMMKNRASLPPIRFDCGTEDGFIEINRQLHRQMDAAGIAHVYEEFPGAHDWKYWTAHLEDTLRFFALILRSQSK